MGLGTVLSAVRGFGDARLGYNAGVAQGQEREAALRQHMIKDALESAARRQTQANSDRSYNLAQSRLTLEQNKKTPQEEISARVRELVTQGTPLLDASRQARLEFGETTPYAYGSPEYILGAVNLVKAREAAKGPRPVRGTASAGNTPVRASQRERYLSQIADRAVEAAGGDVNKAATALVQEPETANIFTQGMSASHMNAAANRYKLRTMGKSRAESPTVPAAPKKPRLTDLVAPPAPKAQRTAPSQQQQDWDEAASALRSQQKHPTSVIGPRPAR